MQRAFGDDGALCRLGELHHAVGVVRLGGGDGQRAAERHQVVRILDHVVLEGVLVESAAGQLLIERHVARLFVERGIAGPGVGTEGHGGFLVGMLRGAPSCAPLAEPKGIKPAQSRQGGQAGSDARAATVQAARLRCRRA
ncbi:hypothetical protein D3C72_1704330 [compost metagenome]